MADNKRRVLILEDDPDQAYALSKWFEDADYVTTTTALGKQALAHLKSHRADLAIIDWRLPDMEGVEVVRMIRDDLKLNLPMIFVTSRSLEEDIVDGLAAGADDYLVKPVRRVECLARADALLRRAERAHAGGRPVLEPRQYGAYKLDISTREVTFSRQRVTLREKELQLIALLMENIDSNVARRTIHEQIWGAVPVGISTRTIDTHIHRLRTKLELDGAHGLILQSVYGQGYTLKTSRP